MASVARQMVSHLQPQASVARQTVSHLQPQARLPRTRPTVVGRALLPLSRDAYFSSFDHLLSFFVDLTGFHLLPTKINKTNNKLKDYIMKRAKN